MSRKLAVVAVDIPSGVDGSTGAVPGAAIVADATVTFQCLKIGLVQFPGAACAGDVVVADIGLSEESSEFQTVRRTLTTAHEVGEVLRSLPLRADAHKGTRGHVLAVGGGTGHYGAAELVARAAIKSGAGLVTLMAPASGVEHRSPDVPELMTKAMAEEGGNFCRAETSELNEAFAKKHASVIGPGMGTAIATQEFFSQCLQAARAAALGCVIDADGLNILAEMPALPGYLPRQSLLTPHPGEASRLLRRTVKEIEGDRLRAARELSERYQAVVVLKGARSVIASSEGQAQINPAATPTLATAGSGDVLSGLLAALLAQGLSPWHAAVSGVYLHGLAGEILEQKFGSAFGVSASDILRELPAAFRAIISASPVTGPLRQLLPGSFIRRL